MELYDSIRVYKVSNGYVAEGNYDYETGYHARTIFFDWDGVLEFLKNNELKWKPKKDKKVAEATEPFPD